MDAWKLSPSDLTFLWDECQRCFYLKVVQQFSRPSAPMPKIFNRIDKLMKEFFTNKLTAEIAPELPPGIVRFGEKWVMSQPVAPGGRAGKCYFRGKFDTVVEFNDGSFGVVDFKTSQSKPEQIAFYSRQLHAYAYALEHPAPGSFTLAPVTKLGLLCVEPVDMERARNGQIAYLGNVTWMECKKDEGGFLDFIASVLNVLELPEPPEAAPECAYCKYREAARERGI